MKAGSPHFVPLAIDAAREGRGNRVMRVVGRLRPCVSIGQARDDMREIAAAKSAAGLRPRTPGWSASRGLGLRLDVGRESPALAPRAARRGGLRAC